jgi:hypothetical protein
MLEWKLMASNCLVDFIESLDHWNDLRTYLSM